jgi:hypothetical protein
MMVLIFHFVDSDDDDGDDDGGDDDDADDADVNVYQKLK